MHIHTHLPVTLCPSRSLAPLNSYVLASFTTLARGRHISTATRVMKQQVVVVLFTSRGLKTDMLILRQYSYECILLKCLKIAVQRMTFSDVAAIVIAHIRNANEIRLIYDVLISAATAI